MALQELFRNEVLHAQHEPWVGPVHVAVPLSFLWLTLLLAALAAAVALFMVFGRYTRYQRVSGQLAPSVGLLGVRSPTQGTVARVYAHQGETVRAGGRLVEISDERNSAALGSTQALIRTQLHAEATRLQNELADQQQSAKEEAASLLTKLGMPKEQTAQTKRQIALEHQQLPSAKAVLVKMRRLAKRAYVSFIETEQRDASALQMQHQVGSLASQIPRLCRGYLTGKAIKVNA